MLRQASEMNSEIEKQASLQTDPEEDDSPEAAAETADAEEETADAEEAPAMEPATVEDYKTFFEGKTVKVGTTVVTGLQYLAAGGFGVVYTGTYRTGAEVVVKIFTKALSGGAEQDRAFGLARKMRAKPAIKDYIVTPLAKGKTVVNGIPGKKYNGQVWEKAEGLAFREIDGMSVDQFENFAKSFIKAVVKLWENGYMHADATDGNVIYVPEKDKLTFIDFDNARTVKSKDDYNQDIDEAFGVLESYKGDKPEGDQIYDRFGRTSEKPPKGVVPAGKYDSYWDQMHKDLTLFKNWLRDQKSNISFKGVY